MTAKEWKDFFWRCADSHVRMASTEATEATYRTERAAKCAINAANYVGGARYYVQAALEAK